MVGKANRSIRIAPIVLVAVCLIVLGSTVITGLLFKISSLVQIFPIGMVFNTAVCFILSGIAMAFTVSATKIAKWIDIAIGVIIFSFASLVLSQDVLQVDLGIDQLFFKTWVVDPNPHPGRMAPNAAIIFMLSGMAFVCLPFAKKDIIPIFLQLIAFIILLLSLLGLGVLNIQLDLVYSWFKFARMSFAAAIGAMLVSIGFWLTFWQKPWFKKFYHRREDIKIILMSGMALLCVSLMVGFPGNAILIKESEKNIKNSFAEVEEKLIDQFQEIITQSYIKSQILSEDTFVIATLIDPKNQGSLSDLRSFIEPHLKDFSAIELYNARMEPILKMGKSSDQIRWSKRLQFSQETLLIWQDGWMLRYKKSIHAKNQLLGFWVTEQRLPALSQLFNKVGGEKLLCGQDYHQQVVCFSHQSPLNMYIPSGLRYDEPMRLAFAGKKGVTISRNAYNQPMITAYNQIEKTGLIVVWEKSALELFEPIRQHLKTVFLIIVFSLLGSILFLYVQIRPLVVRIISSQAKLKESGERLKLAVRGTSDGLWDWDPNTNAVYYSPRLKEILGYKNHEMENTLDAFMSHVIEEDKEKIWQALANHFKNRTHYDLEFQMRKKDGTAIWIQSRGRAIWDKNGKVIHMSGFITDLTTRKEAEQMKHEFISNVSHELRTPLTSIRGAVALVLAGTTGQITEKTHKLLEIASKNCERLILLVQDILDIQKIESKKMKFNYGWINLKSIVKQAIELNRNYDEGANISYHLKTPDKEIEVYVDKDRLLQVLTNLMSNAVKFSEKDGQIEIYIVDEKNNVRVSVVDHGPGIPPEFQSQIFNKFSQADSSSTKKQRGTGLGLHISKALIEQMGGKIGFQTQINQGTTFFFELPAQTSQPKH